jgi:hypothetical protein
MQRLRELAEPGRWRAYTTRRYCTLYAGVLTLLVSGTLYGLSAYTPALKGTYNNSAHTRPKILFCFFSFIYFCLI